MNLIAPNICTTRFHLELREENVHDFKMTDLVAFEAMKTFDHTVGPVKRRRGSWDALVATTRFDAHAYSDDWFSDLKEHYSELEQKVGFRKQDYH